MYMDHTSQLKVTSMCDESLGGTCYHCGKDPIFAQFWKKKQKAKRVVDMGGGQHKALSSEGGVGG